MDINELWARALRNTEIIRTRIQALLTFEATRVPYIFLSESDVNLGDTVVRKGEILVEKPSLYLPPNIPQLKGFEMDEKIQGLDENALINFLLVRGITMPSMKYSNTTASLDIHEDKLSKAIKHYEELLQQQENVSTGLITGPGDCWPFSLLIFTCTQIGKNVEQDIRKLLNEYHRRRGQSN